MGDDNLLLDIPHWIGWLISTVAVIGVFHLVGVHLHKVWYHPMILLITIVAIDYVKHKIGLQ